MKRALIFVTFWLNFACSLAFASNSGVTYQGRILKPDGSPLSGQFTQFKMQIRSPDTAGCLMYEEIQSQDLRNSNGSFSITINDGSGSRTDTTGLTLDRIFANRGTFTLDATTCSTGAGTYVPNSGDGRNLVVLFKDETMATWEPIPAAKINYVPFAFSAQSVQGFGADSLLRVVNGSGDPLTGLSPLSNAQYTELLALANGTSTNYTKTGQLNGSALPTMNSGEVLGWNGTSWVSTTSTPGANSITSTMLQSSSVGTSQIANNVSINTSGTIGAAITTTRDFKIYAASPSTFYIDMQAPALTASYSLVWPMNAGSANQVLTTDGSGNLSWAAPATSSQWTTHGSNISYDGGGNVGIGTTSPANLLQVGSSTTANTDGLFVGGGGSIFFRDSTTKIYESGGLNIDTGGAGNRPMIFKIQGAEKARIDTSGNVGVGTTAPIYSATAGRASVSVKGASAAGVLELATGEADGNGVVVGTQQYSDVNSTATDKRVGFIVGRLEGTTANNRGGSLSFATKPDGGTAPAERLRIDNAGNVGVGTTSPQANFETIGIIRSSRSGATSQALTLNAGDANGIYFGAQTTESNKKSLYVQNVDDSSGSASGTSNIIFRTGHSAAPSEWMRITAAGNVGIGTTSPTAKLDVNGTINATAITINGTPLSASQSSQTSTSSFTLNSNSDASGSDGGFSFQSNGSPLLTIANNGDTAITSTTASSSSSSGALVVSGGLGVGGALNTAGNITSGGSITATTTGVIPQLYGSTAASGNIKIDGTSNATKGNVLLATAGGNVGIGTTVPSQALDVVLNQNAVTKVQVENTNSGTAATANFTSWNGTRYGTFGTAGTGYGGYGVLTANNSGILADGGIAIGADGVTGIIKFGTGASVPERMRIDSSGNVGIGTTSPTGALQIGDSATSNVVINNADTNYVSSYGASNRVTLSNNANNSFGAGYPLGYGAIRLGAATSSFIVGYGTNLLLNPVAGNVGIGTTSPSAALDVNGNINGTRVLAAYGSASVPGFAFNGDSNNGMFHPSTNRIAFTTAGATAMTIEGLGHVGVGTTAPTAIVHLKAGTASANTAPLKFTQGTLLTTAEDGAMEYDSSGLWFTIGTTRYIIPTNTAAGNYSNVSTISNSGGSITMTPSAGNSVIVNQSTVSTSSTTGALIVNGGVGVAGAINSAGNITTGGSITVTTNGVIPQLYGSTAASGNIKIDGTSNATPGNVYLASAGGSVGVGTTSPSGKLSIYSASTATSGVSSNVNSWIDANPGANSSGSYMNYFGASSVSGNSKNFTGSITAVTGEAYHYGTGTASNLTGLSGITYKESTGPVTSAYGVYSTVYNDNSTGAIANAYGLYVDNFTRTGSITNSYGVYVKDSTASNYFAGKVGIGTTSPAYSLDVAGDINFSSGNWIKQAGNAILRGGLATTELRANTGKGIQFEVNGNATPSVAIDSSGNVGIGTTSPAALLHVAGNAYIAGALTSGYVFAGNISSYQYAYSPGGTAGYWVRIVSVPFSAQYMVYESKFSIVSGNTVAKGMNAEIYFRAKQNAAMGSAPDVTVEVDSSNTILKTTDVVAVTTVNTASQTVVELYVRVNTDYDSIGVAPQVVGVWSDTVNYTPSSFLSALPSGTQTAAGVGLSKWDLGAVTNSIAYTSGYVGIGTTSPGANLHVYGASTPSIKIQDSSNSYPLILSNSGLTGSRVYHSSSSASALSLDAISGSSSSSTIELGRYTNNTGGVSTVFYRGNNSTTVDARIQSGTTGVSYFAANGGSVGIGTTSPAQALEVVGTAKATSFSLASTALISKVGSNAMISALSTYGFQVGDNSNNPLMTVTQSGNVGIGTTSPAATLSVNGFAQLKSYSAAPVTCSATYAGAIALTSAYVGCVCNSTSWVKLADGTTACTW